MYLYALYVLYLECLFYQANICNNCRLIFKLTDFGATREMSPNVGAQTLYGTEEYLVQRSFYQNDNFQNLKENNVNVGFLAQCIHLLMPEIVVYQHRPTFIDLTN